MILSNIFSHKVAPLFVYLCICLRFFVVYGYVRVEPSRRSEWRRRWRLPEATTVKKKVEKQICWRQFLIRLISHDSQKAHTIYDPQSMSSICECVENFHIS